MLQRFLYKLTLFLIPVLLFGSWAEDRFATMTLEEKVGQLFVMPVCPMRGEDHRKDLEQLLTNYHIGGVIPKAGTAITYKELFDWMDGYTTDPIIRLADAEWGAGMRVEGEEVFPKNGILAQTESNETIFAIGKKIAVRMRELGLHGSLGPVVDVNSNPNNPIIGLRSFGDDPDLVAEKAIAMMRGLQAGGVLTCAKHFPGHGDVDVDSHIALPVIHKDRAALEQIELIPFRKIIEAGVDMIMTGHLQWNNTICPLSNAVVTGILRNEMSFKGLIISDALNMKGIANLLPPDQIAIGFLEAGHDLLLYGDHIAPNIDDILQRQIPIAWQAILDKVRSGKLHIDDQVLRILKTKEAHTFRCAPL